MSKTVQDVGTSCSSVAPLCVDGGVAALMPTDGCYLILSSGTVQTDPLKTRLLTKLRLLDSVVDKIWVMGSDFLGSNSWFTC